MSYRLSLLEKALIPEGVAAHQALADTVALAVRAEALGYHRIWFAEHHGFPGLASSSPETLAAFILARTARIRVGSGGVMLQHYSPYKIAETFNLLAALAPGRVDLGIGRAPGGLPLSSRALRSGRPDDAPRAFADKLAELDSYLSSVDGPAPEDQALATPTPPIPPERILLGASPESAELAARQGWRFCYAGHFDGNPDRIAQVFDVYRKATGQTPLLALVAFVAETTEAAQALVGPLRLYRVHLGNGQTVNLPNLDAAAEFARQAGIQDYRTEEIIPNVLSGTAAFVRGELDDLHSRFGVEEFVIDSPVASHAHRLASIEGLAAARGLSRTSSLDLRPAAAA
jgi:luciferase family oxidoreductase group 1